MRRGVGCIGQQRMHDRLKAHNSRDDQCGGATPSLSAQLREQTAPQHRQIEAVLRLPGAIQTCEDYRDWLARYLGFYGPLERAFAVFPGWDGLGLAMQSRGQACCLLDDLAALGANPAVAPRVSPAMLPLLPTFAHAIGAFYVVEGATLGGRLILRDLERRIGQQIVGATRFYGGRGDAAGAMWQAFRAALDGMGRERPRFCADAVTGAKHTFVAMQTWFAPFCAGKLVGNEHP